MASLTTALVNICSQLREVLPVLYKKAAAYIGYIMLIMITVVMASALIIWSQSTTKELTESTVNLASGRLECKEVKIDATANPGCASLTVFNKGMINIEDVRITFDEARQIDSGNVFVSSSVDVTDPEPTFSKASLLPIVKERENIFGCNDKKLVITCGV